MILLDVDDSRAPAKVDTRFNGPTIRLPEQVAGNPARASEVWSLPDYDTSEQQHRGHQNPPKQPWYRLTPTFWKAVLFALVLYGILSAAIAVPIVSKLKEKKQWLQERSTTLWPSTPSLWTEVELDEGGPDMNPVKVAIPWGWKERYNTTCDSFTFVDYNPMGLGTFNSTSSISRAEYDLAHDGFVTVRSSHTYNNSIPSAVTGTLSVDVTKNTTQETIKFHVQINTTNRRLRENTRICFNKEGDNRGLTIFTPESLVANDVLEVNIDVLLPMNANITSFVTYLPQFRQFFGDLDGRLTLSDMVVEGASAPIIFQSLGGYSVSIKNVQSPIRGRFNVSSDLTMDVIQGSIDADVILSRNAKSPPKQPTRLVIGNGKSPINVNVTLASSPGLSDSASLNSPYFATQIQGFDGPINLRISHDSQTQPAALSLQLQNSLAYTNVKLDSKFQGNFDVQSRLGQVTVRNNGTNLIRQMTPPQDDESVNNRTVAFDRQFQDRSVGWVGWNHRPTNMDEYERTIHGAVDIRSSIGPVTLDLS